MKAVILAGGKGTRLRPLTYFINKCMLKVGGKPVLEHLVSHLYKSGISQILIKIHYKPLSIMNYFGSRLLYLYQPKLLDEETTLMQLAPWMDDYTVVLNGDTLTNVNLSTMFNMSKGENIKLMDKGVYAGVRIVKPYNEKGREIAYQDSNAKWLDIGTFKNLFKAEKFLNEIKLDTLKN